MAFLLPVNNFVLLHRLRQIKCHVLPARFAIPFIASEKQSVINSKSKQVVKSTLWLEISLLQLQCFIINAANLFHFTQSEKRLFSTTKFNFTTTSESWSSIKHHGNTGLIEMKRRTALKQGEISSECFNFMRRNCFGKNRHQYITLKYGSSFLSFDFPAYEPYM